MNRYITFGIATVLMGLLIYSLFFYTRENTLTSERIDNAYGIAPECAKRFANSRSRVIAHVEAQIDSTASHSALASVTGVSDVSGFESRGGNPYYQFFKDKAKPISLTIGGYKAYTASNSLTKEEIEKALISNGMHESYAATYSITIQKHLSSRAFKRASVFITASALVLTVEELLFPDMGFFKRLLIAISCGIGLLLIYAFAQSVGIMK